jgi:hypothetical protein
MPWAVVLLRQVIPIYGRGSEFDPRQEAIKVQPVPPRPAGQRPSAVQVRRQESVNALFFPLDASVLGHIGSANSQLVGHSQMHKYTNAQNPICRNTITDDQVYCQKVRRVLCNSMAATAGSIASTWLLLVVTNACETLRHSAARLLLQ